MDPCAYKKIIEALWTIFSQVNGNPDYGMSASRFLMSIFFLALLYLTIRMRAMIQYKPHQIIALIGCVTMIIREISMLVFISGWELQLYSDPILHFLWPPIEHFFSVTALSCFAWYTIEASQWSSIRRVARRVVLPYGLGIFIFCTYTLIAWKKFFIQHFPNIVYSYKDATVDWQTHLLIACIAFIGLIGAYMRRQGSSYLFWFWIVTFFEHASRAILYANYVEQSWQATIFHAMHTWAIPLLLLHFINAYVLKMSQCRICHQEVFLGRLYWESMNKKES